MNMTMTNRGHDVLIKSAMLFLTVFMLTIVPDQRIYASSNCTILFAGKDYQFNLDGKGRAEKVRYDIDKNRLTLNINGKKAYTMQNPKDWNLRWSDALVVVADVNKKDKKQELFIISSKEPFYTSSVLGGQVKSIRFDPNGFTTEEEVDWSGWNERAPEWVDSIKYFSYSSGKLKYVQDLGELISKHVSIADYILNIHCYDETRPFLINGNGKLTVLLCVRDHGELGEDIGAPHVRYSLTFKGGRFSCPKQVNFPCVKPYSKLLLGVNEETVSEPGKSKKGFFFKKRAICYIVGLRLYNGQLFFKLANGHGGWGYVRSKTFRGDARIRTSNHYQYILDMLN